MEQWQMVLMIVLTAAVVLAVLPMAVWVAECLVALLGPGLPEPSDPYAVGDRGSEPGPASDEARFVVVVPAHNEEAGIRPTLENLKAHVPAHQRVMVIAHNCTDGTAAVAASYGFEVRERKDPAEIGKVHALSHGIRCLAAEPEDRQPDVMLVVDADCTTAPHALTTLAEQAHRTGRPAQSLYTMTCPPGASGKTAVSALSCLFKNIIRTLGMHRLGLPVTLTGTGVAYPWRLMRDFSFDTVNTAEDYQLAIDLALLGRPPKLCPGARVYSPIAEEGRAMDMQRRRWEHGHLYTTFTQVPRLLAAGLRRLSPGLIALGVDFAVPPLSFVVFLGLGAVLLGVVSLAATGSWLALLIALGGLGAVAATVLLGYLRYGRDLVPARSLASIPGFLLFKIPLYLRFFTNREKQWLRTDRGGS